MDTQRPSPFYFGRGGGLYGCLHRPIKPDQRRDAVLLCYPAFGEYIQCHRAYWYLAQMLAEAGYTTLRFEYAGTGDSVGDLESSDLSVWREDIHDAIKWMKSEGHARPSLLMGTRLGATLAAEEAFHHPEVENLVLWEPVYSGENYLDELCRQHNKYLAPISEVLTELNARTGPTDILGFGIPHPLIEQIRNVQLSGANLSPFLNLLVITSPGRSREAGKALSHLSRLEIVELQHPAGWLDPVAGIYDVFVPHPVLQRIVDWVKEKLS